MDIASAHALATPMGRQSAKALRLAVMSLFQQLAAKLRSKMVLQ